MTHETSHLHRVVRHGGLVVNDHSDDSGAALPLPVTADPLPTPDVRLIDRSSDGNARHRAPRPELKPLPARRTVLVVDDEPMVIEVLVRILQRENYDLITADSGQQALRKAVGREGGIDLLITDYTMPTMSGRELADEMRAHFPDIPVLYQTGFTSRLFEDRPELEARSAFLEKPFTPRGLLEAARFILFGTMNPPQTTTA